MNKQAVRATAQYFPDNDTTRQTTGHQPVARDDGPPVPGYERILKVTIPITTEETTDTTHNRKRLETQLNQERLDELNPIDPGYLPTDELTEDTTLQTWLITPPDLSGPAVIGSSRQLINVDKPLFDDLTNGDVDKNRLNRLKPVLDAHERDPTARGSHADTILNHRTRSKETASGLSGQLKLSMAINISSDVPSQSKVFHELMAIINERRVAPQLPEREALDELRRDTGGEEYSLVLDILDWLRTDHPRRLSYTQITDLFNYCRASVCPDRMLTHFLADLSHGMPPEDIPYHSSYFDREEISRSPSELYNRVDERQQESVSEPSERLLATTFETIRLGGGPDAPRLIKEWWSYDPPAVVAPTFVRHILFLRRLHQQATHDGHSLVRSTISDGGLGPSSSPAACYRYQRDDAAHPLEEAMDMTNPPDLDRLDNRFHGVYKQQFDDKAEAVNQAWTSTRQDWFRNQGHFADAETFVDWITGDAPTDTTSADKICQHYL